MKYDREVIFIRTICDNAIHGLEDEYEDEDLSRDQIFERLKSNFDNYMTKEVFNSCGKKLGISLNLDHPKIIIILKLTRFVLRWTTGGKFSRLFSSGQRGYNGQPYHGDQDCVFKFRISESQI